MIENLTLNIQDNNYINKNSNAPLSGVYGLISEQTEVDLQHNEINFGKAFVLSTNDSKIIMNDNKLLSKYSSVTIPSANITLYGTYITDDEPSQSIEIMLKDIITFDDITYQMISDNNYLNNEYRLEFPDYLSGTISSYLNEINDSRFLTIDENLVFTDFDRILTITEQLNTVSGIQIISGKLYNTNEPDKSYILSSEIIYDDLKHYIDYTNYNINQIENSQTYNNENNFTHIFNGVNALSGKYHLSSKNAIYNFPDIKIDVTSKHYELNTEYCVASKLIFSSEFGHTGDLAGWTDVDKLNFIFDIDNSKLASDYTDIHEALKNDDIIIVICPGANIKNDVNPFLEKINKNLYKRNICIYFDDYQYKDKTTRIAKNLIEFNEPIKLKNFYNGKIKICVRETAKKSNITLQRMSAADADCRLFELYNLESVEFNDLVFLSNYDIKNDEFSDINSITSEIKESEEKLFHLTLLDLENVNSIEVSKCSFDRSYSKNSRRY